MGFPEVSILNNRLQPVAAQQTVGHRHHGFHSAGLILRSLPGDLVVSKQKLRRADAIACVRLKRQEANQNLGFASRPFVLCGLPIQEARVWPVASRKAKRPVLASGDRPSVIRSSLGPGPAHSDLPGDAGNPPAEPNNPVSKRGGHAAVLRDAAGRNTVPEIGRRLSAHIRRDSFFRNRHATRAGGGSTSGPL